MPQDVRYALRLMRRSPVFTLVAVWSLALGIGATTAIFSLINTLILRRLPVREPGRLVELVSRYPGEPDYEGFPWKHYERYRDENHVFSDVIGVSPARMQLAREGADPEQVEGAYVVANFFSALGVQPAVGRLPRPGDDDHAAAVSWTYWKSRLNLDPTIVGRQIRIDNVPATIVGVVARGFTGLEVGSRPDVWLPGGAKRPMLKVLAWL